MTNNTKARHQEILSAASKIVEAAGGHQVIDNLPHHELLPALRRMYKELVLAKSCHHDTAKRNIAKALRLARGKTMRAKWGGVRPGAGRPPKGDKMIEALAEQRADYEAYLE